MSPSPLDLAQRLETDIRRRGLLPGHRYLTAEQSAKLLGTSVATANRALHILAQQDIVTRRRNSGTFVGLAVSRLNNAQIRTVSILVPSSIRSNAAVRFDLIIESILANMQDVADVRVSYVPAEGSVDFVRSLLEPTRVSGELAGVIAISCSREIYQYLGDNKYPLVVMGSLYPDQPFPSIDTDEHQAGRMLSSYLVERGHRRLALFSDSENCPGDNYFHDGVSESLTAANLPHNALVLRAPGPDSAVLRAQVIEVLAMPDRPTGFLIKLPRWADDVAGIVAECGLRVPQDVEIVFKGFAIGEPGKSYFPHGCPSSSFREIASLASRMLAQVRQHLPLEPRVIVIPYELRQSPDSGVVD